MQPNKGLINDIREFERVDSTNKKAKELLESNLVQEGTFILAQEQYAGRGYGNNGWESEPGKNLTGSLILTPDFIEPYKQFMLTKVLSLAIKDSVKNFTGIQHQVSIKWPNDIYVRDKKIAGILVENRILGNTIQSSICGIGININQEIFKSDLPNPVSLKLIMKTNFELTPIIQTVSMTLLHWYELLKAGRIDIINKSYYLSIYKLNIPSKYKTNNHEFTGMIRGTDDYGRLLIEDEKGITQAFDFKEVSFVPNS